MGLAKHPFAAGTVALVLAAGLFAACSSSKSASTTTTSSTPSVAASTNAGQSSSGSTSARSSSTASASNATASTATSAPLALTDFMTPSGNIGCYVVEQEARCDVKDPGWTPTPQPASCQLDWGQGVKVETSGAGQFVCAGDTALGSNNVLQYGQTTRNGVFSCTVSAAGVTCKNTSTGHGFFVSHASYSFS